jgi:ABC-2 type transport system permease protein
VAAELTLVRSPDAVQGMGFIIILPLSFIAGVFVPIAGMDAIPRAIADWDPLSARSRRCGH